MRGGGGGVALAFVLGCLGAAWLPALPNLAALLALAALAGVALAFSAMRMIGICLLGGLWFMAAAQWHLDRQWPEERAGEVVSVIGTVIELPRRYDDTVSFVLRVRPGPSQVEVPDRIRVRWYRPGVRLEPGDHWRMDLELLPPTGRYNPGGFDFERYLLSERIGALGRVRGEALKLAAPAGARWLDRQRQRVSAILLAETVDRDVAALKRALGVADRSGIDDALAERLRQTGTAHLLAISGLHVGMVAAVAGVLSSALFAPLTLLWRRLDRRRVGVVCGLAAALVYAGLAGFSLPTQRASIMLGVLALALLGRRSLAPGRALMLALVAVLLFDPLAALATGFWLSFAAVTVLIWAFAWRPGGDRQWLPGLLRAQWVLLIGLLPLNIGLFGQFIPGAVVANLVAVPLVGLVVLPLLLVELLTILTGLPATPLSSLVDLSLSGLLAFLDGLHGTSIGFLPWAGGSGWTIALAGLGGLWLVAPSGWPARALGLLLMLPLLWPAQARFEPDQLSVWFLDVGNGLAAVVRTADEVVLFDTGPGDGQGGDAISGLLPDLRARLGIEGFDRIVVSHDHRGHAGGLASVGGEDAMVYASGRPDVRSCHTGIEWQSSAYSFRFVHPSSALPDLGGNSSCVLHVTGPGGSVLLTGGVDRDVEARLVSQYGGPPADILQLPSGGHRDGSSRRFLESVAPVLAVASVARFDRYGRVHEATRDRARSLGIELLETGQCGAVKVLLEPGRPAKVRSAVGERRRFWMRENACP